MPDEPRSPESDAPPPTSSRREILAGVGLATVAGLWFEGFGDVGRRARIRATPGEAERQNLSEREWGSLAAALDRLLPSEGPRSPGAKDVNAIGYFDALLGSDEITRGSKEQIRWGVRVLDRRARNKFKVATFGALGPARQDAVLRLMEATVNGVRWLRLALEFCLECFFGDPVHGGNPKQIGWTWAEHQPAFPRPTTPGWTPKEG